MFGNRLIRETGNVVFQDPAFRTDLVNFIHNCTMYDLIDGTLDPATFSASGRCLAADGLAQPGAVQHAHQARAAPSPWTPARTSTRASTGGCRRSCSASRGAGLPAQPDAARHRGGGAIAGQIQQAYLKNSIANAATAGRHHPAERHAQRDGRHQQDRRAEGQRPGGHGAGRGRAQAVAQMNASWLNYGKVAEQALPVFRNVIEAVTYAMFPLFVLLLLLTSGRETMMAFKGYASILIWIQLWPPLYAILNYMASIYAAYDLAAAADLGTGAESAGAADGLGDLFPRALGRGHRRVPGDQHPLHRLGGA